MNYTMNKVNIWQRRLGEKSVSGYLGKIKRCKKMQRVLLSNILCKELPEMNSHLEFYGTLVSQPTMPSRWYQDENISEACWKVLRWTWPFEKIECRARWYRKEVGHVL